MLFRQGHFGKGVHGNFCSSSQNACLARFDPTQTRQLGRKKFELQVRKALYQA